MKNKRNYIIKMSLRKKIKSKWFLGINIFIFIIMLLTININTIINMFGGDYKQEKVISVIDNINSYDTVKGHVEDYSKYSATSIRIEKYDGDEDSLKEDEHGVIEVINQRIHKKKNDIDNYSLYIDKVLKSDYIDSSTYENIKYEGANEVINQLDILIKEE